MTTDCIHCGQNPGEVCRGCYERARREAYDWAGERAGLQHASVIHLHRQVADLSERAVLAEQERDRLRAEVEDFRKCYESGRKCTDDMEKAMLDAEQERDRWREVSQLRHQERDRLREEVYQLRVQQARLREAAMAITDACAAVLSMTHLGDDDLCYPRIGHVRALAKALEETP